MYNMFMFDFYQRRKAKGLLFLPVTRVALFLVVLVVAFSAYTRYKIAAEMDERREAAEAAVLELRIQKQKLEEKVNYLSDERGIEAEMRRQFDVALPGEEVIVILEEEDEVKPVTFSPLSDNDPKWYEFWR